MTGSRAPRLSKGEGDPVMRITSPRLGRPGNAGDPSARLGRPGNTGDPSARSLRPSALQDWLTADWRRVSSDTGGWLADRPLSSSLRGVAGLQAPQCKTSVRPVGMTGLRAPAMARAAIGWLTGSWCVMSKGTRSLFVRAGLAYRPRFPTTNHRDCKAGFGLQAPPRD